MAHPFVATLERELALRKAAYAQAVREGRMTPQAARAEYGRMEAVVDFARACERRFDAERRYEQGDHSMPVVEALATGDGQARVLWMEWMPKEECRDE